MKKATVITAVAITFVEKVMQKMQGGSEPKIERFNKQTIKLVEAQIKKREGDIEDLNEKLVDLEGQIQEYLYEVDLPSIDTIENSKSYAERYVNGLRELKVKQKDLKEQIETKELEISMYQEILAEIK